MSASTAPQNRETRAIETRAIARITWRLVPFLIACYFVAFVDRVNVSFAALQMNADLGFDAVVYGWGAGIFFLGYFFLEVPSNLALRRFGARVWIARIMITWGLISAAMVFVTGFWSFLSIRFALGVAEAGFFPGVILYLTFWFPAEQRAKIVGLFMLGIPLSNALGSPISGALLGLDGWFGLRGWQWLFVLESIPAVALGIATIWVLPSRPEDASWLPADERAWLTDTLAAERRADAGRPHASVWSIVTHPRVLILGLVYAGSSGTNYGLTLWQPQILKTFGYSDFVTGCLNAIPFVVGSVGMVLWGRRSDRTGERVFHTSAALLFSAIGLGACLLLSSLVPTMVALSVALFGCYAVKGPFWALSAEVLGPVAAAAGLAQINALGNLAGFAGPYLIGWIRRETGSFSLAMLPLLVIAVVGGLAVIWMAGRSRAPRGLPAAAE